MSIQKYTNSYLRLSKINRNRTHKNKANTLTKTDFKSQGKKQDNPKRQEVIKQDDFQNQKDTKKNYKSKKKFQEEQSYQDDNGDFILNRSQTLDYSTLQSGSNLLDAYTNEKVKIKNKIKQRLKHNAQSLKLKTKRNTNTNQVFNHFAVSQLQLLNLSQKKNFKTISTTSQKNQLNLLINKPSNVVLDIPKLLSLKIKSEGCQKTSQTQNLFNNTSLKNLVDINNFIKIQSNSEKHQRKNSSQVKNNKKGWDFKKQYLNQLPANKQIALYNYFFKQNGPEMQLNKKIYSKQNNKSAPKYLIVYSLNQTIQNAKLQLLQEHQKMRKQKNQLSIKHKKLLQSIKHQNKPQSNKRLTKINNKKKQSKFFDIQQQQCPELNQWEIPPNFSPWLIE